MDKTISICIPVYDGMPNGDWYLQRCLDSIKSQTYTNYEIVITREGSMAHNTNLAIKQAKGDLIKILYQDDYLAHKDSLQMILGAFKGQWLVTGSQGDNGDNLMMPVYTGDIHKGNNKIGSPSVLTILNDDPLLFDENMTWLLDCDYYKRMYDKYGEPVYLKDINVIIGIGEHQTTHTLPQSIKDSEQDYLLTKY